MKPPKYPWNVEYKYTKEELELIKKINALLTRPLSPRWIYYGLYDIPDAEQQKELNTILGKARKDKRQLINRDLVADDTRTPTIWESHKDLKEKLDSITYNKDIWQDQPHYFEVWMEDQASLEAVMKSPRRILQRYNINSRFCKGFNSIGAMWGAYKFFKKIDKPIKILYYGDLNPSGWAIPLVMIRQFVEMGIDIKLEPKALTLEQVKKYKIPMFTKVSADPRRKEFNILFGFEKWENEPLQIYKDAITGKEKKGKKHLNIDLEKIPIDDFEGLLESDIKECLNLKAFKRTQKVEEEETIKLDEFLEEWED